MQRGIRRRVMVLLVSNLGFCALTYSVRSLACALLLVSLANGATNDTKESASSVELVKRPQEGDKCNPTDTNWFAVEHDPTAFLYCNQNTKRLQKDSCATVSGMQKIFVEAYQQCVLSYSFRLNQAALAAGSGRVSDACMYNTDCLGGMYCSSGLCSCMSSYVQYNKYCYEKINPSQAGCTYDDQCSAVWPGSTCRKLGGSTQGTCRCPENAPRAVETRDGWVCVQKADVCPLPQGGETYSILLYKGANAREATMHAMCNPDSVDTKTAGPSGTCHTEPEGGDFVGETYDCIQKDTNFMQGMCCPNRAFTCTMPQLTAGVGETRWWFNSITQTCTQFSWAMPSSSSAFVNANNFKTREHCESYCQSACPRGNPQYDSVTPWQRSKATSCALNSCDSEHECKTVGSQSRCCPKAGFICSRQGGLSTVPINSQGALNYNPGVENRVVEHMVRYYYDSSSKICKSFQWFGQGGNYNNFPSQAECDLFCSKLLCELGEPLKDANGNYQGCSNNAQCPGGYSCGNNVCCPRKQTICSMPKQVGTCGNYVQRYWYNAITTDCELYTYSGCQGNANNFESLLECQNYCRSVQPEPKCIQGQAFKDSYGNFYQCANQGIVKSCPPNYECYYDGFMWGCCPTKAYTCSLTVNVGVSCGPKSARWYYDTTSQACQTYEYLGCDGNSNNFANRELCETFCGVGGCPNGGNPYRESNNQVLVCTPQAKCPDTHECTRVSVGSSTVHYCCPTRGYICSLPPYQGSQCGATSMSRFYFNVARKECTTFTYNGCGSNGNNFATLAQCNNYCNSAACGVGETVYLDPNTHRAHTCTLGIATSCPPGFLCKLDALSGKHVCCGATDMSVCPENEKAFVDAMTQEVRTCTPNLAGSCPTSFLCRFNVNKNMYFCCASASGDVCPAGKAVFRNVAGSAQSCGLGATISQCKRGYTCQTTIAGTFQGYCCSDETICPGGGEFYTEPTTGNVRMCTVGSGFNTCPEGFQCRKTSPAQATLVANGYCCKMTGVERKPRDVCPESLEPYIQSDMPKVCDPAYAEASCPEGYECSYYPRTETHYCCGLSRDGGCANDTEVFRVRGETKTCSPFVSISCPDGYHCQYTEKHSRYQCCGKAPAKRLDGCPEGQVAYLEPHIEQPRICSPSRNDSCPVGFLCQYSNMVNRYQCCGMSGGCPTNSVAFINPNTGLAQSCRLGIRTTCNDGFSCQMSNIGEYVCCSNPEQAVDIAKNKKTVARCPSGIAPLVDKAAGKERICSSGGKTCPDGYHCQTASNMDDPVCCAVDAKAGDICRQPMEGGRACDDRETETRYFYDFTMSRCMSFVYRGCEGNENNFFTREACDNYCKQLPSPTATTAPTAPTAATVKEEETEKPPMCPVANEQPYKMAETSQIMACEGDDAPCPNGYKCRPSPAAHFHICCGIEAPAAPAPTESGSNSRQEPRKRYSCPLNGYEPYRNNRGDIVECSTKDWSLCPYNSTCQYSVSAARYICCGYERMPTGTPSQWRQSPVSAAPPIISVNNLRTCPFGSNVLLNEDQQPLVCTGNVQVCPNGYACSYSPPLREYYCCSGEGYQQQQPNTVAVTVATEPPSLGLECLSACILRLNNCPPSYACQWHPERNSYFCCREQSSYGSASVTAGPLPQAVQTQPPVQSAYHPIDFTDSGCPNDGKAYIYPFGGTKGPLVCEKGPRDPCPTGYSCQYSSRNRQWQCCSGKSAQPEKAIETTTEKQSTQFWSFVFPDKMEDCPSSSYGRRCTSDEVDVRGCCLPKRRPGEACIDSRQCSLGYAGTRCEDEACRCPPNMLIYVTGIRSSCVTQCPNNYFNSNGACTKMQFADDWRKDDVAVQDSKMPKIVIEN